MYGSLHVDRFSQGTLLCYQYNYVLTVQDVEEVIRMSLERYSADRIAKFDFALENSGGSVLLDKCSPTFPQSLSSVHLFGIPLWYISGTPKIIIQVSAHNALARRSRGTFQLAVTAQW